jgi:hypothetical protein
LSTGAFEDAVIGVITRDDTQPGRLESWVTGQCLAFRLQLADLFL